MKILSTQAAMEGTTPDIVDEKLDELISLLTTTKLDGVAIKRIQEKFNTAIESSEGFQLNNHGLFTHQYKLDRRTSRRNNIIRKAAKITRMVVALLLVGLGWGMIIMPAPPYFEMFTLFYLNPNDGVTIMDVISLIVAFTGVSLFISSLLKFK